MLSDSHSGSHSFKADQTASDLACVYLVKESRILKVKGNRSILVHLLTSLHWQVAWFFQTNNRIRILKELLGASDFPR